MQPARPCVPALSAYATDPRVPLGPAEWAAEPIPDTRGRWVRLIVLRANEWSPAVRAGREEEVARAVAALDLELALFRDAAPGGRAVDALRELVAGGALPLHDPLTAKMLEAFGWKPLGELVDDAARRGPAEPTT